MQKWCRIVQSYRHCTDLGLSLALVNHATLGWNLTFLRLGGQLVTNSPVRTNLEQLFSFVGSHPNLERIYFSQ